MKSSKMTIAVVAIVVAAALLFWLTKEGWESSTGELPETTSEEVESTEIAESSMTLIDALTYFTSNTELKEHLAQTDWDQVKSIPQHMKELSTAESPVVDSYLNGFHAIYNGDSMLYRSSVRSIAEGEGEDEAQDRRVVLVKDLYLRAVDQKMDETWSRINLSNVYLMEEQPMQAVRQLLTVEKQDSNNTEAIYRLAMMSVQSGQLEKARDRFKKLVSLQPQNSTFREQLLSVCQQLDDSECVEEYSE